MPKRTRRQQNLQEEIGGSAGGRNILYSQFIRMIYGDGTTVYVFVTHQDETR
jgi:hypothetical protein